MTKEFLAKIQDIPKEEGLVVRLSSGQEIALFHTEEGFYAIENACPHMGGPLSEGLVEGGCVSCPWHGWEFDIKTGACTNHPSNFVKSYPLTVEGTEIFLMSSA